ncbi:MAG: phosphatase PAP2 family protein [Paenibacillaceae bacterium]
MTRTIPLFIGVLCFIGFVLIAISYQSRLIIQLDEWLIQHIQHLESNGLTDFMKFFSFIGSGPMVAVVAIAVIPLLFFFKHRIEIIIFIVTVSGTALLNTLLKLLFQRTRPVIHPIIVETGYSFPSGHSMGAFTLYGTLTLLLWRNIPSRSGRALLVGFSLFMILCIGLSRVYLGVHYPSDVIGAYLVSGTCLIVIIVLLHSQWMLYR